MRTEWDNIFRLACRVTRKGPVAVAVAVFVATGLRALADERPLVIFTPPGGVYSHDIAVKLSAGSSTATVRYTVDGSEPGTNSPAYAAPIPVGNTVLIKAKVFPLKSPPTATASQTYTLLASDLTNFTSNLPLVILNVFGQTVTKEAKVAVSARFIDPRGSRCGLTSLPDYDGRALLNLRGRSSLRYPKNSFNLKTRDDSGEPDKVSLLGLPKESDWALYAPYPDKTLLRDALAYELSNEMGRYAPRSRFVEVFVNHGGKLSGASYAGVYVLLEKIKRDKNRVNVEKLGTNDLAEPEISGGYIFKKDHMDEDDEPLPPYPWRLKGFAGGNGGQRLMLPSPPGGFPANPAGFLPPEEPAMFQLPGGAMAPMVWSAGGFALGSNVTLSLVPPGGGAMRRGGMVRLVAKTNGVMVVQGRAAPGGGVAAQGAPGDAAFDTNAVFGKFSSGLWTRRANFFYFVEPKADEIAPAQKAWLSGYLERFEGALYGPDFKDAGKGYRAFVDVDSFIDHHLFVEATKNIDGFRFSTFYHKPRGGKLAMGPVWDWNLAFGNASGKQGYMPEYWYWPQLDDQQYSYFRRIFEDPDFAQQYVDRWAELRRDVFSASNVCARVDRMAGELKEAQARNFKRWPILATTIKPNYFAGNTWQEEIDWMKQWIQARLAWMNKQILPEPKVAVAKAAPAATPNPTNAPAAAKALTLAAPLGKVYFTLDGSDPRLPGGGVSPKAQVYQGPVALKDGAQVFARAQQDKRWSSPTTAKF